MTWEIAIYETLINACGVTADFVPVAPAAEVQGITAGYRTLTGEDQSIINAVGIGGRVVTIKNSDVATRPPQNLDRVRVAGKLLTIQAVNPVFVPGSAVIAAHKCYCKG